MSLGRWAARNPKSLGDLSGLPDLNEALGYAVDGGYRIYEADARIGLAWAHLAAGDSSAGRAQQMSAQMGYHWGQVDATEALAVAIPARGVKAGLSGIARSPLSKNRPSA